MLLGRCDCHCRVDDSSSSIPPSESSIPPSESMSDSGSGSGSSSDSGSSSSSGLSFSILPPNHCCLVLAKHYTMSVSGMPQTRTEMPTLPYSMVTCHDFDGTFAMRYGPATALAPPASFGGPIVEEWFSAETVVVPPDPPGLEQNCLYPDDTEVHVWALRLQKITSGDFAGNCFWAANTAYFRASTGLKTWGLRSDFVAPSQTNCFSPPNPYSAWGGTQYPGGGAPPATATAVLSPA